MVAGVGGLPGCGNLAALLPERAALHPGRTALVEYRRGVAHRLTFGDLARRVAETAGALQREGLQPGDRVLLLVPMSVELYVTLLAVLHAGGSAVFLDAWSGLGRIDAAVRAARPDFFLGSPRAQLLRVISPSVRSIRRKLVAPVRCGPPVPVQVVDPGHAALLTLTTGSTGRPKIAARSHAFLWAQHTVLSAHLGLREGDVDMPALPIFVLGNLAQGIPSVLPDFNPRRVADVRPERILRQMDAEGVTTTGGSPAFYQALAEWCGVRGRKIPVRALFTGGAPVLPRLARLLVESTAGEAHMVYGSTEAEPISGIPLREMLDRVGERTGHRRGLCAGLPVPEVRVRILRPVDGPVGLDEGGWSDLEVAPGEVGEVVVAGPHVLSGYLDDPRSDRENKIREAACTWHRTGDAAYRDEDGRLWLMGRVSQRVRREGRTWWPLPVEIAAGDIPGVTHAAYLGVGEADHQHALLVLESNRKKLGSLSFGEELVSAPVDDLRVLSTIPRDARHASKTDVAALRRRLRL